MPAKDMGSASANEAVRLRMASAELFPLIGEKGVCVGLCMCGRPCPIGVFDSMPGMGALPRLRAEDDSGAAFRLSEARLFVMPLKPGAPRLGDCRLELMPLLLVNTPLLCCNPFGSVGDRSPSSPGC